MPSGAVTRKGLTTPLTRRVASGCYLCAGAVYILLLGSPTGSIPWFHYWGKYLPSLCYIFLSSWGKYRRSPSRHHHGPLDPLVDYYLTIPAYSKTLSSSLGTNCPCPVVSPTFEHVSLASVIYCIGLYDAPMGCIYASAICWTRKLLHALLYWRFLK